jgi:oligopeptide/dipeptide ABC transporter ATP-binding protein
MGLAMKMLAQMGIFPAHRRSGEYPHQYSGGMIQRALTAMGLISGAPLILLDEPTKGLDPHSRDHMLGVLKGLEQKTIIMVTHDLAFAQGFADRIGVMLGARLVELADAEDFFERALHPYAQALLRAQPRQGLRVQEHFGDRLFHGSGCPFEARCETASSECREMPPMTDVRGHWVRCWHHAA